MKKQLLLLVTMLMAVVMPMKLWAAEGDAEPYAVLTGDTLLTFFYDDQKVTRNGMDIASSGIPSWFNQRESITKVIFDDSFAGCTTLTSTAYWFYGLEKLTAISGIGNLNTPNVTSMNEMFYGCSGLTNLDVSGFNTENVTDMSHMFSYCSSLTNLDVSHFNTAKVTNMLQMFSFCSSLTSLDVSHFNTENVWNMNFMFEDCSRLASLDVSYFNTDNVTNMYGMFYDCSSLTSLDISHFNTAKVTNMYGMFYGCSGLTSINVSNFNTANVTDMSYMFSGCSSLTSLDVTNFKTDKVTNMFMMFNGSSSLTSLDVSHFSTENVTNMGNMFYGCSSLTSLDVTGFNTENVTDMNGMFSSCSSLTSLDVTRFNTAKVTNMSYMFHGCSGLTSLDVSHFSTENVTNMGNMFYGCSSLTSLDVTRFNTANVTNMSYMFRGCLGLTNLDVSHFNTENVTDMSFMFYGCSGLSSLDVSGFNTANVTDLRWMFRGCSGLKTIYVGDGWMTNAVTSGNYMFMECTSLVGGAGTIYDANHTDHTYAHIDGGTSNPGYFTANNERVINGNFVTTDYSSFAYALEDNGTVIEITDNNIVEDSEEPGNRCIKIVSKDNATENWDSHFIIRIGEPLKEGQTYKFSMRAKASRNVSISSQARTAPDQYLHYKMLGNFDLTTGWQTYNVEGVVESEQAGCTVIALLLNVDKSSAEYYFDDISFRVNEAPSASPEPYAVLSDNNTKLTFFYDTDKDARGGMSVGPFDLNNYPSWYNQRESITTVEFDDSFANCTTLTSTAFWFYNCGKITSIIGMNNLKTDNVTDMGWMFSGCSGLTSLSVSGFNTANVTYMGYMFYGCSGLTSLDVSNFNTANVEDMLNMFYGCSSLTTLDVSRFNTANVTLMGGMFQNCSALTAIDVSNFNTDKVTVMTSMFADCSSLTSLDVANFNTTNVTRMGSMFGHCSSVTSLDVSRFNTANVTDMGQMFSNCSSLTSLDVSGFKTDNVTEMRYMFYGCSGLTSLDVSRFNTANVTNMVGMFSGCSALTSLDVSGFNTDNVTSMNSMFENCSGLNAIDISNFNTANVKYMDGVFRGCSGLTSLDVSRFNTENVTAMRYMFYGCSSLTSLDVTNFKTDHVTSMQWMFRDCSGLTSLDVSHFNTENVVNMSYMFANCSHITSLDVSNFNTSKVTDMSSMFYGCSGLTSLNVSNFNTSNATTMTYMFGICSHIATLDLSNFNTSKVTDMNFMFKDCSALTTIFVGSEWVTSSPSATVDMFEGCTSLVGGAGTTFDANHTDYTYAHIDGGSSNPGYFTAKNAPEGEATFDGKVARVSGERTLDEAFEQRGGRAEATRTIAAIIWNKESALTESDLQGITNPNLLVYVNDASLAPQGVQNVVINGLAREIVLTDAQDGNNDWYAPQAFVAERISYTRNFAQSTTKGTSRGWESIALPFDVQSIQHESKGVIAPFNNSASNKHFWLRRLTDNGLQAATNIEANTPYIISMPNSEEYTSDCNLNGRVTFSAQNIDVPATTTKVLALADSSIVMVPAMQRQSRSSSVWALNVGEVRGQYFEGSVFERDYRTVRPFEAYTIHRQENGQPAPRYVPIQEIAGTTGIETINREPLTLNQWYDMQGRKLEGKPARKGVYISNGKKVVVK